MLTPHIEQWKSWIRRDLGSHSDADKLLRTFSVDADSLLGVTAARWTLWTRRNRFSLMLSARHVTVTTVDLGNHPVTVATRDGSRPPYFGCIATSRSWRAGEDWHRGNDLPDGEFSEALWQRILCAILSYEVDEPVVPSARATPIEGARALVAAMGWGADAAPSEQPEPNAAS